jgi:hypothetical protein
MPSRYSGSACMWFKHREVVDFTRGSACLRLKGEGMAHGAAAAMPPGPMSFQRFAPGGEIARPTAASSVAGFGHRCIARCLISSRIFFVSRQNLPITAASVVATTAFKSAAAANRSSAQSSRLSPTFVGDEGTAARYLSSTHPRLWTMILRNATNSTTRSRCPWGTTSGMDR